MQGNIVDMTAAQEICTEPLTAVHLRDSLPKIASFLSRSDAGPFTIAYGWGCDLPADDLWKPQPLEPADLVRVVEQSEQEGILTLGQGDLIIDNQSGSVHFLICHESDLHLATSDRGLLEQTAAQWRAEGLTVYVSP